MESIDYNRLKKNLKKDVSNFKKVRLAILGDFSTQLLTLGIKGFGVEKELNLEIYEGEYDQIEQEIFISNSMLYSFDPEYVIIFNSPYKLLKKFYSTSKENREQFSEKYLNHIESLYNSINKSCRAKKIIFSNFSEINDSIYGNFSCKVEESFVFQIRKINFLLLELAVKHNNFYINDICSITTLFGINKLRDTNLYISSDMIFSIEIIPTVAKNIINIIQSTEGSFIKCVIFDLDNTIWGGTIGDDGIENIEIGNLGIGKAYTEIQMWLKELKKRGIILAVCSKNEENIAKEPFEKHPEMYLNLDDISVFVSNWNNKADNIRHIQSILNIGFDSMVFIDDNPFEREIVKKNISGIFVPDLPESPADYLVYLQSLNLFETASISEADEQRTKQYQEESKRMYLQQNFTNEEDFLKSLEMLSTTRYFQKFDIPRVSQLTQRSNQFNLRTVRYTDEDIKRISSSNEYLTCSFMLKDRFGDYGLIGVIILKKIGISLFIDTWIMSCRVLKRTMENFMLNKIVFLAKENGFNELLGEYIPTLKNSIVKNHYADLGFKATDNLWKLSLDRFQMKKTFIIENCVIN